MEEKPNEVLGKMNNASAGSTGSQEYGEASRVHCDGESDASPREVGTTIGRC